MAHCKASKPQRPQRLPHYHLKLSSTAEEADMQLEIAPGPGILGVNVVIFQALFEDQHRFQKMTQPFPYPGCTQSRG